MIKLFSLRLLRALAEVSSALAGLPLIFILQQLRPFVVVSIGFLQSERIGHLVANTEYWLRCRDLDERRSSREVIFLMASSPANRQILTMIGRKVCVIESRPLLSLFRRIERRTRTSPVWADLKNSGFNSWAKWNGAPPQLRFTESEQQRGKSFLRTMGIPDGAQFICFCARDSAYLDASFKHRSREGLSYHDYRDCDINNYVPAAERMAAKGLWALRMGAIVGSPITSNDSRVIDYASNFRSDFADVYLMAYCKFFLGCTAGNWALPAAFGVPSALANMTPFGYTARSPRDLFIPKKYREANSKRLLSFREIVAMGADVWLSGLQFENAGIEVVENTADEILALATELNARLDGDWEQQSDDEQLQDRYRSLFRAGHQMTGYQSRVGAAFLRDNIGLLN
jgi:putative glycosyltransferase (TIGR04372 family)